MPFKVNFNFSQRQQTSFKALPLLLVGLTLLVSCGKKSSSSSAGPESQVAEIVPVPLPENSSGVVITENKDTNSMQIMVPARKRYNPSVFENGWAYVTQLSTLILPASLPVTQGRPGNHLSFVILKLKNGVSLNCVYVGTGSNTPNEYKSPAQTYRFDFCVEEGVAITPSNRASLKISSKNRLDASVRESSAIHLERGDKIEVSVNNSNRKGSEHLTGEVSPVFDLSL